MNESEYMALAEFRYQMRKYLRRMEAKARKAGHNPQQYQVLLAIKGLPKAISPTISVLAERMQLNHNSMVELVDRCEERGLLRRARSGHDRRQVRLVISREGEKFLHKQARAARQELRGIGPVLAESVQHLLDNAGRGKSPNGVRRRARGSKEPGS